jgi:hypothetical protein
MVFVLVTRKLFLILNTTFDDSVTSVSCHADCLSDVEKCAMRGAPHRSWQDIDYRTTTLLRFVNVRQASDFNPSYIFGIPRAMVPRLHHHMLWGLFWILHNYFLY